MDASELILYMARNLVESPDQVTLTRNERDNGVEYELRVAARDLGKVIGRNGKTVRSMRTVLGAVLARTGERAQLKVDG